MKKKLMALMLVGLLACPSVAVFAQDDTEEDTIETATDDTEAPTEDETEETEETEEEVTDDPVYEEPVYEEVYEEPVEIEYVETEETTTVEPQININELVANSFANPAMQKAFKDYQFASDNFTFNDELQPDLIGTSIEEVQSAFEAYLSENSVEDAISSATGKKEELGKSQTLTYFYFYPGEEGDESKAIAELKYYFDDNKLTAISILNHAPIITSQLSREDIEAISSQPEPITFLTEKNPTIVGLVTKVSNEYKYKTLIIPMEDSEKESNAYIELYIDQAKSEKIISEEALSIKDQIVTYINSKEPTKTHNAEFIEGEEESTSDIETSSDSISTESVQEESESETSKSTQEGVTTSENDPSTISESSSREDTNQETSLEETSVKETEDNQGEVVSPILEQLPLAFDYDETKLNDQEKLVSGFENLLKEAQDGQELDATLIKKELGEPNSVKEGEIKQDIYFSISEEDVIIIHVTYDANDQVISVKNELRNMDVIGAFPITVDELYTIGEDQESIIQNLAKEVGNPTIVDIQNDKQIVRFVWTRLKDEKIKNVEVEQNITEGSQSLMYYEP